MTAGVLTILLTALLRTAACGALFWLAATRNDWVAGVGAGMFLAYLIRDVIELFSLRGATQ